MMWKLYKRDEGLYLTENKKALLWDSETGCMETAILKSGYWFQYPGELYDEDGKKLVMVHEGGSIVLMDLRSGDLMWLTKAKFDESPSFSPNGDMVLYMTEQGFEPTMIVASVDGRVRTKVEFVRGDVREPAWSPLRK